MNGLARIDTDRLSIRRLVMRDKEAFFSYRSLPDVQEYQGWRPTSMEEIALFIRANETAEVNVDNTWLQLAVCLKDGSVIGDIGVHFPAEDFQVEIGYTLSPAQQGKGYASEAVKAVIDTLFSVLLKHRVFASVDPNNLQSIRLLEKLHFRKEAHFIKRYRIDDQWHDDCVYAMLKEEWM